MRKKREGEQERKWEGKWKKREGGRGEEEGGKIRWKVKEQNYII